MEIVEDEPLTKVQIRYAKGEIDTAEYENFHGLYIKTRPYQHLTPLKILLERYLNGEIEFKQFKETLSRIINDIVQYGKTEPIRFIQMRYAKGEIETRKFETLINTLQTDINSHPLTPAHYTLYMRLARGDLDLNQYIEMINSLSVFTKSLKEQVKDRKEPQKVASVPQKSMDEAQGLEEYSSIRQKNVGVHPPGTSSIPDLQVKHDIPVAEFSPSLRIPHGAPLIQDELKDNMCQLNMDNEPSHEESNKIELGKDTSSPNITYKITGITEPAPPVTVIVHQDKVQPTKPPSTVYFNEVKELIKEGSYSVAMESLDNILDKYPNNSRALFFKGIALFNTGHAEDALSALNHAKKYVLHIEEEREIDRIYSHIQRKIDERGVTQEGAPEEKISEEKIVPLKPSETISKKDPEPPVKTESKPEMEQIKTLCDQVQNFIDTNNFTAALNIMDNLDELAEKLPYEDLKKLKVDDLYAAKGFVFYQLKKYCDARRLFMESIKINPRNDTSIHYLNDIRVRDCNKYVRHT